MDLSTLQEILRELTDNDIELLMNKGDTYGDSWKKRGGVGAFMMLARKWDRIEKAAQANDYDIFKALDFVDYLIDDVIDLGCYLLLVRSENYRIEKVVRENKRIVLERNVDLKDNDLKKAEEPQPYGYVNQDGNPWTKPVEDTIKTFSDYGITVRHGVSQQQKEKLAGDVRRWNWEMSNSIKTSSFIGLMARNIDIVESYYDVTQASVIYLPLPKNSGCEPCED